MDLNRRRPSVFGRVVYGGFGLLVFGLVLALVPFDTWFFGLPHDEWFGFGWMLGGLIVMVAAFVIDRLRGRKTQADSRRPGLQACERGNDRCYYNV